MSAAKLRGITTRVFDITTGAPAPGIPLRLERHGQSQWQGCGIAITGADGRAHLLGEDEDVLEKGDYRLTFEIAAYFKAREVKTIFPFVQLTFSVEQDQPCHVPLALGPFGYSIHAES